MVRIVELPERMEADDANVVKKKPKLAHRESSGTGDASSAAFRE